MGFYKRNNCLRVYQDIGAALCTFAGGIIGFISHEGVGTLLLGSAVGASLAYFINKAIMLAFSFSD